MCCSANANASGLGLLQAAKPLQLQGGVQPRTGCKHPSKPKPLRATVAAPTDVLVELVVEQSSGLHPACLLPQGRPLSQVRRTAVLGCAAGGMLYCPAWLLVVPQAHGMLGEPAAQLNPLPSFSAHPRRRPQHCWA